MLKIVKWKLNIFIALAIIFTTFFLYININYMFICSLLILIIIVSLSWTEEILLIILFSRTLLDNYSNLKVNIVGNLNVNLQSIFGIGVILLFGIFIIKKRTKISKNNDLFIPFILFILILTFSLIITVNFGESIISLMKNTSQISIFFMLFCMVRENINYKNKIFNCLILSSIIPLLYGLYQIVTMSSYYYLSNIDSNRINSTFYHPTQFALFLLIICVITYCKFIESTKFRALYIGILILCTVEIIFTYTRAVMIGYVIFWCIIWFYQEKKASGLVIAAISIVIGSLFFKDIIVNRFMELLPGNSLLETSEGTRYSLWSIMFPIALKSPIMGYGTGSFLYYSGIIRGSELNAHNDYLRVFFENGVLGLICFLYIIANLYYQIKAIVKKGKKGVIIALGALLSVFILIAFNDNVFFNPGTAWYFWAFTATVLASYSGSEELNKYNRRKII